MFKKSILLTMIMIFSLFIIAPVMADEKTKSEQIEKEQLALIQASQKLAEEEKKQQQPEEKRFAIYAIGLDPEYEKVNLGGRFELSLLPNIRLGLECFQFQREESLVGFFSLIFSPFHKGISPYIGGGEEITGGIKTDDGKLKRYQVFAGVELGRDFFVEVKYVSKEEINIETADVYSIAGFKISF